MYLGKKIGVIIPAAGKGKRMCGPTRKQFLELDGKPILLRTIDCFENSEKIDCIVLAVDHAVLNETNDLVKEYGLNKIFAVIEGGEDRQDSVWNALRAIKSQNIDIIIIHDSVRPFISDSLLNSVLQACIDHSAVIVCVRPKDTVKESLDENFINKTLKRDNLWIAQTPQAFNFSLLYNAFEKAYNENFYSTDEASLLERLGSKVRIIEGSYDNIKITTPEDLELAKLISKRLSRGNP